MNTFSIPAVDIDAVASLSVPGHQGDFFNLDIPNPKGADAIQLDNHLARLAGLEGRKDIFASTERDRLKHDTNADRENFILNLRSKHGYPSSYNAPLRDRRAAHNNPAPKGVLRRDLHPGVVEYGSNLDNLRPGDLLGDEIRHRVKTTRYQAHDGRTLSDGTVVDSFAGGEMVSARQSAYEAMMSRPTDKYVREMKALMDMRGNFERMGRVVSVNWQGPKAVHRSTAESGRIPRRQVDTHGHTNRDGTSTYKQPWQAPEVVMQRTINRAFPGRREVSRGVSMVERPMIEEYIQGVRRPVVFELRRPNPSDTSTYVGDSNVIAERSGQLQSSYMPNPVNGASRPMGKVPDNRVPYQVHINNPVGFYNTEFAADGYARRYDGLRMAEPVYQRQRGDTTILNKVQVVDRVDQLLTHRDPLMVNLQYKLYTNPLSICN